MYFRKTVNIFILLFVHDLLVTSNEEIFFQGFLVILKRILQNYYKILKKCDIFYILKFSTTQYCFNFRRDRSSYIKHSREILSKSQENLIFVSRSCYLLIKTFWFLDIFIYKVYFLTLFVTYYNCLFLFSDSSEAPLLDEKLSSSNSQNVSWYGDTEWKHILIWKMHFSNWKSAF